MHEDAGTLPDLGGGQRLAAQALIPIGLFNDPDEEDGGAEQKQPEPVVWMTGVVRAHRQLNNEVTGRPFHWLRVESLAATYDLVADPDIVTGEISEGKIIEAMTWMFARVID